MRKRHVSKFACSIEGCNKPRMARGWCCNHYERWRRNGDPTGGKPAYGYVQEYFDRVVLNHDSDDCLFWPFFRFHNGYPSMTRGGNSFLAHRYLCTVVNGPPPDRSYEASHTCGNGRLGCVAKNHLVWKTHIENERDKTIHGTLGIGEKNKQAKVTESEVREIRSLTGRFSQSHVAKLYGLSQSGVSAIQKRKSWAWLE